MGRYWTDLKATTKQESLDCAAKALSLDNADPFCQMTMGFVLMHLGQQDRISTVPSPKIQMMSRSPTCGWVARVGCAKDVRSSTPKPLVPNTNQKSALALRPSP